jgi:hypothetical protein
MQKLLFFLFSVYCFSKNLTLENRFNPPARELMDVEIVGDIMIIPGNLDGYDFYDISNPTLPVHISNTEVPMGNRSQPGLWVSANDSIAFFSSRTRGDGPAIIDFSNPHIPELIGSLPSPGGNVSFEGSDIYGNLLAIACHEDGVLFYDISEPQNPNHTVTFETENAWSVEFIDPQYMAIGDDENGLIIYAYDCNEDSCLDSYLDTEGAVKDLAVFDYKLYVAEGSAGVSVWNVGNPSDPFLLDRYDTPGLANKISIFDSNRVAVSDWLDVKVLEWTGESLELVGYKSTGKRTMSIGARDGVIYSAEWQHLQTFSFGEITDADLDISSWDISYPTLEIGESDTVELIIENNGQIPLGFTTPTFTHNDFSVVNFPDYLDAGLSTTAQVIYTRSNQNASGVMQITSNDPDEPEIEIQLIGNYEGGIVGIEAPDFTLPIVANGTGDFTLSDHLGKIVVIAFFAPG